MQRLIMCCFDFLVISIFFVPLLNKVKQKIPNEKILHTVINLNMQLSLFWLLYTKYVRVPRVKNWFNIDF